jgi:LysM repeat protein
MALDSQSARSGSRQRHRVTRRRTSKRTWLIGIALIFVATGGGYLLWPAPGIAPEITPGVSPGTAPETTNQTPGRVRGEIKTVLAGAASNQEVDTTTILSTIGQGNATENFADADDTPADEPIDPMTDEPAEPAEAEAAQGQHEVFLDTPLKKRLAEIQQSKNDVEARQVINQILADDRRTLSRADRDLIRQVLTGINTRLVYSKVVAPDDPLVTSYLIRSGDVLSKIAKRYKVDKLFLARINGLPNPDKIRAGQKLKIVRGPFHAIIEKAAFRMDLYLVDDAGQWVYVSSMPVGLGEHNSTPLGKWAVKPFAKVKSPQYTNPRTNEVFAPNDPRNPLGGYWIGLEGMEMATADLEAYGIHGTIEPKSIGKQASMGCIRLGAKNIEALFGMLVEGESKVTVKR